MCVETNDKINFSKENFNKLTIPHQKKIYQSLLKIHHYILNDNKKIDLFYHKFKRGCEKIRKEHLEIKNEFKEIRKLDMEIEIIRTSMRFEEKAKLDDKLNFFIYLIQEIYNLSQQLLSDAGDYFYKKGEKLYDKLCGWRFK